MNSQPRHPSSPAVDSLREEQQEQARVRENRRRDGIEEADLDTALENTFPASDPVAQAVPTTPGLPEERTKRD